jgi:hypothetical protein
VNPKERKSGYLGCLAEEDLSNDTGYVRSPWLRSADNNGTDSDTSTNGGALEYTAQESKNIGLH